MSRRRSRTCCARSAPSRRRRLRRQRAHQRPGDLRAHRHRGGLPRLLGGGGEADRLDRALDRAPRLAAAVREVVRRRQAQHQRQLPRPPRRQRARRARSPTTGRASRATRARSPTATSSTRPAGWPTPSAGSGVKKGDRVAIYMPMIPELPVAMLACARIGAPHSRRLRRLQRRCAGRPHRGRASARRSSPPTAATARAPPCR